MFKILYNLFFTYPKVGMELECVNWGADYTSIRIERVSPNKKEFLYSFITCKGSTSTNNSTYSGSWPYILDTYSLILK